MAGASKVQGSCAARVTSHMHACRPAVATAAKRRPLGWKTACRMPEISVYDANAEPSHSRTSDRVEDRMRLLLPPSSHTCAACGQASCLRAVMHMSQLEPDGHLEQ